MRVRKQREYLDFLPYLTRYERQMDLHVLHVAICPLLVDLLGCKDVAGMGKEDRYQFDFFPDLPLVDDPLQPQSRSKLFAGWQSGRVSR